MINRRKRVVGGIVVCLVVITIAAVVCRGESNSALDTPPNIVFILTDDLDLNLMPYMQNTNTLIAQEGAVFKNYFVTSPACCPSRATILRGQYPHNTTILENSSGFERFYRNGNEKETIATWLQRAGYRTSFLGKYLNLYPAGALKTYIPPGWTDWHVFLYKNATDFYFAYTMNENGELVRYHKKTEDYSTDVIKGKAVEFINKSIKDNAPFFALISVYAPHGPSSPAPRHAELYRGLEYPKGIAFNEGDISDKPSVVRSLIQTSGKFETVDADSLFMQRVRSMQAVDEMVGELIKLLDQHGQLNNTYIFFTSDNGFHMGEHGLSSGKMLPYEEDIHVPLLVRGPGIEPNSTITQMVANLDLAPTIADMAGVSPARFVDGRSFLPFLNSQQETGLEWRQALLLELGYLDRPSPVIAYRGIRTERFTYIEYESGETEFYDLLLDPYQLNNLANSLDPETLSVLHSWLEQLKTCKTNSCRKAEAALPDNFKYPP